LDSTLSDGSGGYQFSAVAMGGNYTVTPTKGAVVPGSPGIDIVDVIATQRHFLNAGTPLSGCRLTAADVNGDSVINIVDVIAMQRFYLGLSTGIANTGQYQFSPVSRSYTGIGGNQGAQNYDTLVLGDVVSTFAERMEGPSQTVGGDERGPGEILPTVAVVALPNATFDASASNFVAEVTTTTIEAKNKLVGFQGDFSFDERVVTFQSEPVEKAGITGGNWSVSGNVLPGTGPIRTLRISGFSNDLTPLSGSGGLFELRLRGVSSSNSGASSPLIWAAPPNSFLFIDSSLQTQAPGSVPMGTARAKPGIRKTRATRTSRHQINRRKPEGRNGAMLAGGNSDSR